ncbi:MAG: lysophospholipid acyltransferase family protein [Acidobacteriota bacterium]
MTAVPQVLDLIQAGTRHLSRAHALAIGRRLGDALFILARSRRRLALANLQLALADTLNRAERRQVGRRVFRHFGEVLVETLLLPDMVADGLERHVRHEGWEHLQRAVNRGKGAIVFTGHFGNWEVVALAQGARGIPMDVVGRPPDNRKLASRLERVRQMNGNRSIDKHDAVRPMLRSLRDGRTVGLVIDQNVGAGKGVYVDFFGHPASTTPALALLALKTGAPVIPVFGYPEAGGHRVVYSPRVEFTSTGDRTRDVRDLTTRVTKIIEERVREHPDLWLWMHNRWRSRPETSADRAAPPGSSPHRDGDATPTRRVG